VKEPRPQGSGSRDADKKSSVVAASSESEGLDTEEILKHIPESEIQDYSKALLQSRAFLGPLPPPVMFEHYDKVLPGSADRILEMAEQEQKHRIWWERQDLKLAGMQAIGGQVFGFLLMCFLIGSAVYCATIGATGVAIACLGGVAVGAISKFLANRWTYNDEPDRK